MRRRAGQCRKAAAACARSNIGTYLPSAPLDIASINSKLLMASGWHQSALLAHEQGSGSTILRGVSKQSCRPNERGIRKGGQAALPLSPPAGPHPQPYVPMQQATTSRLRGC